MPTDAGLPRARRSARRPLGVPSWRGRVAGAQRREARACGQEPRARRALAPLALLAACAAPSLDAARVTTHRAEATLPASSRLELLSVLELRADVPAFAGFSSLEVSEGGARLVALSDRGLILEAGLARPRGAVAGLTGARLSELTQDGARPPSVGLDSEGLAIPAADLSGPRFVSFERDARLLRLQGADGRLAARDPAWDALSGNTGLEALAVPPEGGLLALAEAPAPGGSQGGPAGWGRVPAWRIGPEGVAPAPPLPRLGDHSVTGADFGPDGRLYVLARRLDIPGGFSFAIWRYAWAEGAARDGEILLELPAGSGADNAEGLAAWRDETGRLRLAVITDDNFALLQRTLLFDFAAEGRPPD